ncbi:hypothetical protein EFE22_08235 [Lactobacillus delbrueckii subsp. lactis]|nr:hypothetical protein [Lactobacillus delbrueckii subsp. lactis]
MKWLTTLMAVSVTHLSHCFSFSHIFIVFNDYWSIPNSNQSVDFGGPAIEKKMKRMGHSKVLIYKVNQMTKLFSFKK